MQPDLCRVRRAVLDFTKGRDFGVENVKVTHRANRSNGVGNQRSSVQVIAEVDAFDLVEDPTQKRVLRTAAVLVARRVGSGFGARARTGRVDRSPLTR